MIDSIMSLNIEFFILTCMSHKYLLCFHDYSIWNYKEVTPILHELKDIAGAPFSILVIPDVRGASESQIQDFRKVLLDLHQEGFELALHGFLHKADMSLARSYLGHFQLKMTNNEAEFAGLNKATSRSLLNKSVKAWNDLINQGEFLGKRIHPAAFVPPTWYGNPYLSGQARKSNLQFESRFTLEPIIGNTIASPVVSFAGIPRSMEKWAILFGKFMLKQPFGRPRIALHPCDFPRLKDEIVQLIQQARLSSKISYYRDL